MIQEGQKQQRDMHTFRLKKKTFNWQIIKKIIGFLNSLPLLLRLKLY